MKNLRRLFLILLCGFCTAMSIRAQGYGLGDSLKRDAQTEKVLKQLIVATGDKELAKVHYQVKFLVGYPHKAVESECAAAGETLRCTVLIGSRFRGNLTKGQLMAVLAHELGHWVNQYLHEPPSDFQWIDHEIAANRYAIKTLVSAGFDLQTAQRVAREALGKSYALNPCEDAVCEYHKQLLFDDILVASKNPR